MVQAVRVHTVGGRHRLQIEDFALPHPGCNEVEVRHRAIGLHYPDIEDCQGSSHHASHSVFTPGRSAVGVITELGTGVLTHQVGQRVGYVSPPNNRGAFSEASVVPTSCLVPIPSSITDEEAAVVLFPGLTAWMAVKKLSALRRGDAVLVHSAARGLGSLIAQWAKHVGAFVIGSVASERDGERARENGCQKVVAVAPGWAEKVREVTDGEGVAAVFGDKSGTFVESLACLAPKGMLVCLGGAVVGESAPVLDFKYLAGRGSLTIAVPVLEDYVKRREDVLEGAQLLFELHKAGQIKVEIANKIPLDKLELGAMSSEDDVGSCVLIPPVPDPKSYQSRSILLGLHK